MYICSEGEIIEMVLSKWIDIGNALANIKL